MEEKQRERHNTIDVYRVIPLYNNGHDCRIITEKEDEFGFSFSDIDMIFEYPFYGLIFKLDEEHSNALDDWNTTVLSIADNHNNENMIIFNFDMESKAITIRSSPDKKYSRILAWYSHRKWTDVDVVSHCEKVIIKTFIDLGLQTVFTLQTGNITTFLSWQEIIGNEGCKILLFILSKKMKRDVYNILTASKQWLYSFWKPGNIPKLTIYQYNLSGNHLDICDL